ncbi:MAG TPA: hypothetical protein VK163_11580, partial [Opitutaceae bacterium]|nr:hypothetical protein [Opitutaceae bacterium]
KSFFENFFTFETGALPAHLSLTSVCPKSKVEAADSAALRLSCKRFLPHLPPIALLVINN